MNFSVLLSIYVKEKPKFLRGCLESLKNQTLQATEIIMVFDGEITEELESVVAEYSSKLPIKIIRLPKNKGLGNALSIGIKHCSYELVARMDTDDICVPKRFEKQINYVKSHPEIDVLGANVEEFNRVPKDLNQYRILPESHNDIVKFAKFRSPINHPTVMFKKSKVLDAGNYKGSLLLWEDYTLWVNLLNNGAIFHNLPEILLYFRVKDGKETIARRKGIAYAKNEIKFANYARKIGFFSWLDYIRYVALKPLGRLLPINILLVIYNKFYRKKNP